MRRFLDLYEAPQTLVFAFGRFNPPTTGHEKLINKVASVAGSNPYRIYPSFTTNPKKDPLPHSLKVAYMRKMFPKHKKNIIADRKMKTAIFIAEAAYKEGFKNLIMVVGSDRVKEFTELLNRYNDAPDKSGKQLFKFDSVKVVSAGERDPDAEGVSGMSASKMRVAAADGDKDAFLTGVPSNFKDGEKLYRDVRKYMGIREERDMGDMSDFETVRDMYLTGKIWNAGDIVEAKGITGEVVRKGTNYLSFVDEDGKVHKAWLHEIELNEKYDSDKFFSGKGTPEQRLQLLKLQNKALKALGGSPKQKEIKKEINALRKKMGMKVKEEIELDERNYKKEYANYHSKPEQIERRSSRNKARRVMGDKTKIGMDVGHKDNDPMNNDPKNLRNEDPSKNRREPRLREDNLDEMSWYLRLKNKIDQMSHPKGMEKMVQDYMERAKKKLGKQDRDFGVIKTNTASKLAADVAREYGQSPRGFISYINDLIKKGKLPKELKAEYEPQNETMSFKDFVNQIQVNEKLAKDADAGDYIDDFMKSDAPQFKGKSKEKIKKMAIAAYLDKKDKSEGAYGYEKQDPDIKDKKGTQPAKYYKGIAKSTKKKRDAYFKKQAKKADDDPSAYKPAPGDTKTKTKPSVHTKKFKQMYGEQINEALKLKLLYPNKNSEMLVLNVVDTRGKGRVEVRGKRGYESGEYDKKDKLHKFLDKLDEPTVTKLFADDEVVLNPNNIRTAPAIKAVKDLMNEDGPCWDTHKQVGMKKKGGKMVPNCVPKNEEPRIPRKKGQPAGSDKHSDLYTDENPKGTIHGLGFKDVETAKASVKKIIGSGKSHAHKIQAAIAMEQRARVMGKTAEANVYRAYIDKMKKKTKEMQEQAPDTSDAMKRYKAGKAGFTDIAHLKAKGLIKRADGEKRKSPKYEDACCEECETESLIIKENIYRVGSEAYFQYFVDIREKFNTGDLYYKGFDKRLMEGDIGKFAMYEGEHVPLECPMMESEYQGKDVELNKPKAGGPKKYYVYVKDPSTGNVKKVSWGDTTGLKIKLDDKEARKSFAARHKCDQKKDKTKAGYWACNMPRYAKQLGLSGGGNFFW